MARVLICALLCLPAPAADSAACARCHRAIYDAYMRTPMALSAGTTGRGAPLEQFRRAAFTQNTTGFEYRVSPYFVEFEKGGLHGRKAMPYYIGSGAAARSYLLASDGFLTESPVAYYAAEAKWDLAPGYNRYAYPYLMRPIQPACLNCHASFLQPVANTQNRYGTPPFREGGVACERCHGPGEAHIAQKGSILNPARLAPDRRDSICAQCHLSGEMRVLKPRANWQSYHPGDRLADSLTVFVRAFATPGMTVTSHVEKLAQSACKRAAGDHLWCGTCHDPHAVPAPSERARWFRKKCVSCHECKESRAARAKFEDDCTACHMPKSGVTDAEHVVYTDHSIPRRPHAATAAPSHQLDLVPFEGFTTSVRDVALAYGIAASRGRDPARTAQARMLLEQAMQSSPDDVEVLLYLGEIYRNADEPDRAAPLYERAIRLDPAQVTASVGLGGILFERGNFKEAVRLWQDALSKNTGLELVRTNLAMAQWRAGDLAGARATLRKAIDLSPAFQPAIDLSNQLK